MTSLKSAGLNDHIIYKAVHYYIACCAVVTIDHAYILLCIYGSANFDATLFHITIWHTTYRLPLYLSLQTGNEFLKQRLP